jgi:hypothetical protein
VRHAGEPGRVALRRLTSGEYAYTVKDLTGIDIDTARDFVPDAVGGEGFTNYGDVQFMADASLERYLQAAKKIASHAVIGAGPLQFYVDPGKSGRELSAINRIQAIYTKYGFRSVSGEGGKPYGLESLRQSVLWGLPAEARKGRDGGEDCAGRGRLPSGFSRISWRW